MTLELVRFSVMVGSVAVKRGLADRKIRRDVISTELVDVLLENAVWRRSLRSVRAVGPKYIIL